MSGVRNTIAFVAAVSLGLAVSGCIKVKRTDEINYRLTSWVKTPQGIRIVHSDYRVRGESRNNPTFGNGWSGLGCSVFGSAAEVPESAGRLYVLTTDQTHLGDPNGYHCGLLAKYLHFTNGADDAHWQDQWADARVHPQTVDLDLADAPALVEISNPNDLRTLHLLADEEGNAAERTVVRATLSTIAAATEAGDIEKRLPWLGAADELHSPVAQRSNFVSDRHNPLNFCKSFLPCASIDW